MSLSRQAARSVGQNTHGRKVMGLDRVHQTSIRASEVVMKVDLENLQLAIAMVQSDGMSWPHEARIMSR